LDGGNAGNPAFNIWVMSADGSFVKPYTTLTASGAKIISSDAVWSHDGNVIAFDTNRNHDGSNSAETNGLDVWTINADGTGPVPVTFSSNVPIDEYGGPVWSPMNNTLAFNHFCCGLGPCPEVDTFSTGSSLTRFPVQAGVEGWSPDGTKLLLTTAKCAFQPNTANVAVMNTDGSGFTTLTQLTASNADSFSPIWSPNGAKIAFVSARALDGSNSANLNSTNNIWVMNADGTGAQPLTRLTASGAGSSEPSWSGDSSKLAFVSARALDGSDAANLNTTTNVWLMNADGTGAHPLTKLTAPGAGSEFPDWSPDGSKLAFDSSRALDGSDAANGVKNIWVVSADGSNATPLSKVTGAGDSFQPKWRP
jgi:Tol biopolymer transport system component